MSKKARVKKNELEDLVDLFEGSRIFVQPRPEAVDIENDSIRVSYKSLGRVAPLAHSDLFTSFAKLAAHGKPSEAKIRNWVGRFGLPVRSSLPQPEDTSSTGRVVRYKPMYMRVHDFREEAGYAHDLLSLYVTIRGRDATSIKTMIRRMRASSESSELEREFLEMYRANQHSLLTESGDFRTSSFRKAFPAREAGHGIRGTMIRSRESF